MKKLLYFASAILTWQVVILLVFISCTPEPQPTCTCYKRIYFQHLQNPIQFLFQEETNMTNCDNWTLGDDTKTDDNGYLYNYKKECE